jgi:small multidrug resistance pump
MKPFMTEPLRTGWMRGVLYAAAAYNFAWGALAVACPLLLFNWSGMAHPRYPELWQCIGMLVGVYGAAYAFAARDPFRLWPIVFAGLLGKVLGPIGFGYAALQGRLPWSFGWTILSNDLIWWIPFGAILWRVYRRHSRSDGSH